jgi:hypothetical protein
MRRAASRLAHDDDEQSLPAPAAARAAGCRVEQHAHRDEEQHREGVAQRQGVLAGAVAEGDSLSIMPAKKAPSANDTPNSAAAP